MSTLTFDQAYDEVMAATKAGLDAAGIAAVHYPDMDFTLPSGATPWARVSFDLLDSGQASFADRLGRKRFRRLGLLSIQLFHPLGGGSTDARIAAKVLADAFEGQSTSGGVWFRDLTGPSPVGANGGFSQTNLAVSFEYDEVK